MTRTVLWIDDQPSQALINRAYTKYGISIVVKECYTDGIEWLHLHQDICDAVILDVNCKISMDKTEAPSMDVFRDFSYQVYALCENNKFIPWFVYTGGGYEGEQALSTNIPVKKWTKKQYYEKPGDRETLLDNIIELTSNAENVAIRSRYKEAFSICDVDMDELLLSIAKVIESGKTNDTTIFNNMRKLLAKTVPYCNAHGLLPDDVITSKQARKFITAIYQSQPVADIAPAEIVPSYISWNYSACEDIVNNGSHTEEESNPDNPNLFVDADVTDGKAPFLGRATFFQILTLLTWMSQLPKSEEDIENLRLKISKLNIPTEKYTDKKVETDIPTDNYIGVVACDGNTYYCGEYMLTRSAEQHLHQRIEIVKFVDNTNEKYNDKYPYFCQRYKQLSDDVQKDCTTKQ